jgi:hypothetical protein
MKVMYVFGGCGDGKVLKDFYQFDFGTLNLFFRLFRISQFYRFFGFFRFFFSIPIFFVRKFNMDQIKSERKSANTKIWVILFCIFFILYLKIYSHTAVGTNTGMYIFGGMDKSKENIQKYFSDFYCWNFTTKEFSTPSVVGASALPPRFNHSCAVDNLGTFFFTGGKGFFFLLVSFLLFNTFFSGGKGFFFLLFSFLRFNTFFQPL